MGLHGLLQGYIYFFTREIQFLSNMTDEFRVYMTSLMDLILNQMNPVQNLSSYFWDPF
jgi:hypothetical protein